MCVCVCLHFFSPLSCNFFCYSGNKILLLYLVAKHKQLALSALEAFGENRNGSQKYACEWIGQDSGENSEEHLAQSTPEAAQTGSDFVHI